MTGENLRKALKTITLNGEKIILSDLATKLGMDRQSLNSKLNAKRVDDNFIKKIASTLNTSYETIVHHSLSTTEDEGVAYVTKSNTSEDLKDMLIESQQEQIRLHKKVEALHDKIIALYEAGK